MDISKMKMVALACAVMAGIANANETPAAIPEQSVKTANADITVEIDGKATLDEAFAKFAKEAGIEYGKVTPDGRMYNKGFAVVAHDVSSPAFMKSRAMAYERAYLDALARFIMDAYGTTATETISEYYRDDSSDVNVSPIAGAKTLTEKVGLLAEAKLDKALAAEGVPADKYANASVAAKRVLFKDSISKKIVNKAFHMSSGCVPVKTFESWGTDNTYYIGVIVRYDRTSKALAMCFKNKMRPALTKEGGLSIAQVLPSKKDMPANFGVRLYFNENGTPTLISFGQYGIPRADKKSARAKRAESHALAQARNLADAGLTSFINSWIDVSEESMMGEDLLDANLFMDDGSARPEEVQKIVDIYRKRIKQSARDTMKGRSTVFQEILTHENGQKVAAVVRSWSFDTVDAVEALDRVVDRAKMEDKPSKPAKPGFKAGRTYDF